MFLHIRVLLVSWALIVAGAVSAVAAPKIIEGFQSTAQPGATGGTQPSPEIDDPEKLFGDVKPPADDDLGESGPSVWDMPLIQLQAAQLRLATAALFQPAIKLASVELPSGCSCPI